MKARFYVKVSTPMFTTEEDDIWSALRLGPSIIDRIGKAGDCGSGFGQRDAEGEACFLTVEEADTWVRNTRYQLFNMFMMDDLYKAVIVDYELKVWDFEGEEKDNDSILYTGLVKDGKTVVIEKSVFETEIRITTILEVPFHEVEIVPVNPRVQPSETDKLWTLCEEAGIQYTWLRGIDSPNSAVRWLKHPWPVWDAHVFVGKGRRPIGAFIELENDAVALVYYKPEADAFLVFCMDHMDNISEDHFAGKPEAQTPRLYFDHKAKLSGIGFNDKIMDEVYLPVGKRYHEIMEESKKTRPNNTR